MVNILSHGGSKTGSLVIFEVFLALVIDLNQYKDIRTIIAKVSTLERIDYGIHLFEVGFGNYLILSGGAKANDQVEADEMYKVALDKGISPEAVLRETKSQNTYENVLHTKRLLSQHSIKGKVILVTSPYHMQRAVSCFKKQGVEVLPAPVNNSEIYVYGFYQNLRNLRLLMHEFLALVYFRYAGWI